MDGWLVAVLALMAGVIGLLAGFLLERARAAARQQRSVDDLGVQHASAQQALAGERDGLRAELAGTQRALDEARVKLAAWQQSQQTEEQRLAQLGQQFRALAAQVVSAQSEEFLKNAGATLEQRSAAIVATLAPFREQLDKLAQRTSEIEVKRESAYGSLSQQLAALSQTTQSLQSSSTTLLTALRGSGSVRGRWGEMQLRNIAELAGMTRHCDFDLQVTLEGGRPDMVVNLPGGEGRIPVDAKAPMDAYMRALDAPDAAARATEQVAHAAALRKHVLDLARRDYAGALGTRVDFTVLFVPGEPILSAAFEAAPDLQAEAMERRVLIVTPVTLVALLRTVALYWRQQLLADKAQELYDEAREFHRRVTTFMGHVDGMGGALASALKKFNSAVGSYERMVLPQGRRLEELAPPPADDGRLPELSTIEDAVRPLAAAPAGTERPAAPRLAPSPDAASENVGDAS